MTDLEAWLDILSRFNIKNEIISTKPRNYWEREIPALPNEPCIVKVSGNYATLSVTFSEDGQFVLWELEH